jgi:RNA polymerase sigma factor (sigma-70 family)
VLSESDASDRELLREIRRDPDAVGVVYDRYALRLVRYLQQQGVTEEVALDAAQEVFARLIVRRRAVRVGGDGSLWPWLAVTGRNLIRDWQRRRTIDTRARRRIGLPAAIDESGDALARVEGRRLRPALRVALAHLTPEQRTAVTARVVQERDYAEIAEAEGATEDTVRNRVSRGLRAMHTFLQGGSP